ncbi:unnamed protein product [Cunninghamella echinulata]
MEGEKNTTKAPQLCIAGCGFYGNEIFNNMCSKCFKEKNKTNTPTNDTTLTEPKVTLDDKKTNTTSINENESTSSSSSPSSSRKHPRPPSIISEDQDTPLTSTSPPTTTTANTTASSPQSNVIPNLSSTENSEANTPTSSDKPLQTNKGRCFKCRIKVPLAKQTINKCKCDYVFCDSHRFPDKHDCDVDYAKMGRDLLARNNPRLHERPKGGRSFKRIDSL